jgi:hypothetical protein
MKKQNNEWIKIETVSRDFAKPVDWDNTSEVTGTVVETRQFEQDGRMRRVIEIETDEDKVAVFESALLRLDTINKGMQIRIVNKGWTKLKSGRRARSFELYVREPF